MPDFSGGAWGGAAAGVQEASNTAMTALSGIANMQQNKAIMDANKTKQALEQFQLAQAKKTAERNDRLINIDMYEQNFKDHPAKAQLFNEVAAPYMQPGPDGKGHFVRTEDFATVHKAFHSDKTMENQIMMADYKDVSAKITSLQSKMQELQGKGGKKNEEELAGIQKQLKEAVNDQAVLATKMTGQKAKGFQMTSTGGVLNKDTGDVVREPTQKEPSANTDFATFKAGRPKKEGETDAQWNKRVSDEWEAKQDERAKNKTALNIHLHEEASEKLQDKDSFKTWTPEAKQQSFMENIITGKPPVSASGLGGNNRKAYDKEYEQWKVDNKFTPGMVARMKADYQAGDKSLSNQKKNYDMMNGFVMNINNQVDRVDQIYSQLPRTTLKLVNMPIKDLRKYVTGSGDEASAKAYLIEISNEVGKLSTGSAASIRELSESAQKQWAKIHDEALSYNDLMKVLHTTKQIGSDRLNAAQAAMNMTRQQIEAMGGGGQGQPAQGQQSKGKLTDPNKAKEYLQKAGGDKAKARELAQQDGYEF